MKLNIQIVKGKLNTYKKEKPEPYYKDPITSEANLSDIVKWRTNREQWRKSFYAELLEDEFTGGDKVYVNGDDRQFIYARLDNDKSDFAWIYEPDKPNEDEGLLIHIKDLSHYHNGQEIDSNDYEWVEEVINTYYSKGGYLGREHGGYTTAEEPSEYIGHEVPENINPAYAQFHKDIEKRKIKLKRKI